MIRVLVSGAAGRMGSEVVRAVTAADGMEVVAGVDPGASGLCVESGVTGVTVVCQSELARVIEDTKPDVMVDFTHPSVVEENLRVALAAGVDCVVGTTGVSEERLAELAAAAPEGTTLFFAPNFAIGAVLMMRFAEQAARFMPYVEITELHHDKKADAPSGTAVRTARMIAAARGEAPSVPGRETELPGMEGARGAVVDGVHVHSVRLPGLVAHQEVIFGSEGQLLTIRHDTTARESFADGVLLALDRLPSLPPGLTLGLEALL